MHNFRNLRIDPKKVIKSEELNTYKGGIDGCSNFLCMCYGLGVWQSCYCSPEAMVIDINAHCGGLSGSCAEFGS